MGVRAAPIAVASGCCADINRGSNRPLGWVPDCVGDLQVHGPGRDETVNGEKWRILCLADAHAVSTAPRSAQPLLGRALPVERLFSSQAHKAAAKYARIRKALGRLVIRQLFTTDSSSRLDCRASDTTADEEERHLVSTDANDAANWLRPILHLPWNERNYFFCIYGRIVFYSPHVCRSNGRDPTINRNCLCGTFVSSLLIGVYDHPFAGR